MLWPFRGRRRPAAPAGPSGATPRASAPDGTAPVPAPGVDAPVPDRAAPRAPAGPPAWTRTAPLRATSTGVGALTAAQPPVTARPVGPTVAGAAAPVAVHRPIGTVTGLTAPVTRAARPEPASGRPEGRPEGQPQGPPDSDGQRGATTPPESEPSALPLTGRARRARPVSGAAGRRQSLTTADGASVGEPRVAAEPATPAWMSGMTAGVGMPLDLSAFLLPGLPTEAEVSAPEPSAPAVRRDLVRPPRPTLGQSRRRGQDEDGAKDPGTGGASTPPPGTAPHAPAPRTAGPAPDAGESHALRQHRTRERRTPATEQPSPGSDPEPAAPAGPPTAGPALPHAPARPAATAPATTPEPPAHAPATAPAADLPPAPPHTEPTTPVTAPRPTAPRVHPGAPARPSAPPTGTGGPHTDARPHPALPHAPARPAATAPATTPEPPAHAPATAPAADLPPAPPHTEPTTPTTAEPAPQASPHAADLPGAAPHTSPQPPAPEPATHRTPAPPRTEPTAPVTGGPSAPAPPDGHPPLRHRTPRPAVPEPETARPARPDAPAPTAPAGAAAGLRPPLARPEPAAPAPAVPARPAVAQAPREAGLRAPLVHPAMPTAPPRAPAGPAVPQDIASAFAHLYGADVSDVPVHRGGETGAQAARMSARAFTRAGEVHLPEEAGPIENPRVRGLLAHELTHAVQQRRRGGTLPAENTPVGAALEWEAQAVERHFRGDPGAPSPQEVHEVVEAVEAAESGEDGGEHEHAAVEGLIGLSWTPDGGMSHGDEGVQRATDAELTEEFLAELNEYRFKRNLPQITGEDALDEEEREKLLIKLRRASSGSGSDEASRAADRPLDWSEWAGQTGGLLGSGLMRSFYNMDEEEEQEQRDRWRARHQRWQNGDTPGAENLSLTDLSDGGGLPGAGGPAAAALHGGIAGTPDDASLDELSQLLYGRLVAQLQDEGLLPPAPATGKQHPGRRVPTAGIGRKPTTAASDGPTVTPAAAGHPASGSGTGSAVVDPPAPVVPTGGTTTPVTSTAPKTAATGASSTRPAGTTAPPTAVTALRTSAPGPGLAAPVPKSPVTKPGTTAQQTPAASKTVPPLPSKGTGTATQPTAEPLTAAPAATPPAGRTGTAKPAGTPLPASGAAKPTTTPPVPAKTPAASPTGTAGRSAGTAGAKKTGLQKELTDEERAAQRKLDWSEWAGQTGSLLSSGLMRSFYSMDGEEEDEQRDAWRDVAERRRLGDRPGAENLALTDLSPTEPEPDEPPKAAAAPKDAPGHGLQPKDLVEHLDDASVAALADRMYERLHERLLSDQTKYERRR